MESRFGENGDWNSLKHGSWTTHRPGTTSSSPSSTCTTSGSNPPSTNRRLQQCPGAPTPDHDGAQRKPEADGNLLQLEEHRIFRRVVGIARFFRTLRPDIGFAVKELSHRLAALRVRDFERCKRLCRYLNGTSGFWSVLSKRTRGSRFVLHSGLQ